MATTCRSHRQLDEGSKGHQRRRLRPGQSKEQGVLATRLVLWRVRSTRPAPPGRLEELATSELYSDGKPADEIVTEHRQLKGALDGLYTGQGALLEEAEEQGSEGFR